MGFRLLIFSIISLFPEMFDSIRHFGVTSRAFENNLCQLLCYNPRDFTTDPYRRVDDRCYGGGPGMVMKIEPLELAITKACQEQYSHGVDKPLKVYLSPQGKKVDQQLINQLSTQAGIVFVCGRYEGVDERFIDRNIDVELSLGDFVVSGGELPAMMLVDAVMRLIPGVLNDSESAVQDSFMHGLLDCPHYTLPRDYLGASVPDVLLSGNHAAINKWRLQQSLWRTYLRRPDLLESRIITKEESRLLNEMQEKHKI